jgi:hypothetical protein
MKNHIAVASAALMLSLGGTLPAMAQAPSAAAPALVEVDDDSLQVTPFGINVDQLEELDVVTPAGDRIGDVEEVLADSTGKIVAVVVEYGGFMGVGEKEAVFQLNSLKLQNNKLVTTMTKQELEALPNWP